MEHLQLDGLKRVLNFRGKKISMLETDLSWRTFEVNVCPSTLLEAVCRLQAGIVRIALRGSGMKQGQNGQ
jgi:hypothetical protein